MSRTNSPLAGRALFITGARRSGTYWLQRIITAHENVGAVPSESHLFSHGISPLLDRLSGADPSDQTVGRVHADREAVLDSVRDLCDVVLAPYRAGAEGWVSERTPLHVYHLGLIASVYPDGRFIQIVRDGRDVARSLVEQEWGPTTHEAAALEWRDAIRAAGDSTLPAGSYREVRYEDLLTDPEPLIADLFDWLGLKTDAANLAGAVGEAGQIANTGRTAAAAERWRTELTAEEISTIESVCSAELERMGYELSGGFSDDQKRGRAGRGLGLFARRARQR